MSAGNSKYTASVVTTYWFVAISRLYLDKVLLSDESISVSAPLFVGWFQCVMVALLCWAAGEVGEFAKSRRNAADQLPTTRAAAEHQTKTGNGRTSKSCFSLFPSKVEYNIAIATKVFPHSLVFVGMIVSSSLCLKWVEVSFYTVARSLTQIFVVVLCALVLGSPTSPKTMGCLGIIILGFFMGVNGEVNFSMRGTIAGVCSSLFEALTCVFAYKVMPAIDDDHRKLTFYHNLNAAVLFIPLVAYFEAGALIEAMDQQFLSGIFWGAMIVSGVFGFGIGIIFVLQFEALGLLPYSVNETAVALVQSITAYFIWNNPATFMGVAGLLAVLGGSLLCTITVIREQAVLIETSAGQSWIS